MTRARWGARALARLVPRDLRRAFVDDFEEAVSERCATDGAWRARWWYCRQLTASVLPVLSMWRRGSPAPAVKDGATSMGIETVWQDLRYAARWLRRSPAFTIAAAATIALGIGANTAIFSIVHALLLKPLPYPNSTELVTVWQDMRARGGPIDEWATPGNLVDWREEKDVFASMASMRGWGPTLTGEGDPEPLRGENVSVGYFETLGVHAAVGRTFRPDEAVPNAPRVVVLSDSLWRRRFGADRNVIGRRIVLGGEPHEIVGVMPPDFRPSFVTNAEVFHPDRLNLANPSRGAIVLRVIARLQPGVDQAKAKTAMNRLAAALAARHPDVLKDVGITIIPFHERVIGAVRPGLLAVFAAVLMVLLIACVNIANLLLARAASRTREMAVRAALGAARTRVVRQLLTESVLLSAIGSAIGLVISRWASAALIAWAPAGTPRLNEVGLDASVLLFAAGLTIVTGVVFGLVPAFQLSRDQLAGTLKDGARGTSGSSGHRLRRVLIVAEIAVALILLVGSGLFLRSFLELRRANLGFNPDGVLVGFVTPPATKYPTEEHRIAFVSEMIDRAAAIPGVTHAAISSVLPLSAGDSDVGIDIEGAAPPASGREPATWYRLVSSDYFNAMGIKVREGRGFERQEAAPVVIVNDALAKKFWPGQRPLGRHMRLGGKPDAPWFTVVGIVDDVKQTGARGESRLQTFVPYTQVPELAAGVSLVVKTSLPVENLEQPLRLAMRGLDPDVPIAQLQPMDSFVSDSIAEPRFLAFIVGLFAVLAVIVAGVGVYGLMSYAVTERRTEIGVRLALGAASRQIFGLVVGDGMKLALAGIAIGVAGALVLSPLVGALLFAVPPTDLPTFAATALAISAIAIVATMLPARRAMRVDPVRTLRGE